MRQGGGELTRARFCRADALPSQTEQAARIEVVGRALQSGLSQLAGFVITFESFVGLAEVRKIRLAQDIADSQPGLRQLELQRHVAARVLRQTQQVIFSIAHHHFAQGRRTLQLRQFVVVFENKRIRQVTHIAKTPLGQRTFVFGDAGLPPRQPNAARQT